MSRNLVIAFSGILTSLLFISCTPQQANPSTDSENIPSASSASSFASLSVASSSAISLPVQQTTSTSLVEASPKTSFTKKTYYDAKTGLTFWHPARLSVIAPKSFTVQAGEIGYEIKSPTIDEGYGVLSVLETISVVLKPDTTEKSSGPVIKKDLYSPSGGNLSRQYVLYTGRYRVTVYANYDVYPDLYKGKMNPSDSISDLVQEDLGGDLSNPIKRLIAVYPNAKTLSQFYRDADAIVLSMEEGETGLGNTSITEPIPDPQRSETSSDTIFEEDSLGRLQYFNQDSTDYCGGIIRLQSSKCLTYKASYITDKFGEDGQDGVYVHISVHENLEARVKNTIADSFGEIKIAPTIMDGNKFYVVHTYFGSYYYWLHGQKEIVVGVSMFCSPEFISTIEKTRAFEGQKLTDEQILIVKDSCSDLTDVASQYLKKYPSDL